MIDEEGIYMSANSIEEQAGQWARCRTGSKVQKVPGATAAAITIPSIAEQLHFLLEDKQCLILNPKAEDECTVGGEMRVFATCRVQGSA